MTPEGPRHLLVQARGEPSPLYEPAGDWWDEDPDEFIVGLPLEDSTLALPADLLDALRSWSLSGPAHDGRGLAAAQRLARHLGPSWTVRYWDERHGTTKWLCWGCDRLRDSHDTPPHPVDITVEGEFKYGPLRSDGFGDFFPDDPAAALDLSDGLVADLYTWARSIDDTLNLDLRDRVEGKYDAEWDRLFREGSALAQQLANELGPSRTVTYKGLANGGLAAITSVAVTPWRPRASPR